MDRLTHTGTRQAKDDTTIEKVVRKLCEYEDTRLTPEEIDKLETQLEQERESRRQAEKALELACVCLCDIGECMDCPMLGTDPCTIQKLVAHFLQQAKEAANKGTEGEGE